MLSKGGKLCADFYVKRFISMCHVKYLIRPITKRLPYDKLFLFLKFVTPFMLALSQMVGRLGFLGKLIQRLIPVADYTNVYSLSDEQLKEWALLDTFDMLTPKYDFPQDSKTIKKWCLDAKLSNVSVINMGHLVCTAYKS